MANNILMPTQTASEGRQYTVEFHYHQRRRATRNTIRPIGFVHHINDLPTTCDHVKYVDDCTLWEACSPSCAESSLQTAADEVAQWTTTNKIALNYDNTEDMRLCFSKKKNTKHPGDIDK